MFLVIDFLFKFRVITLLVKAVTLKLRIFSFRQADYILADKVFALTDKIIQLLVQRLAVLRVPDQQLDIFFLILEENPKLRSLPQKFVGQNFVQKLFEAVSPLLIELLAFDIELGEKVLFREQRHKVPAVVLNQLVIEPLKVAVPPVDFCVELVLADFLAANGV